MEKSWKTVRDCAGIEEEFFVIDKESNTARIERVFDSPDDCFIPDFTAKLPLLSDDFADWIGNAFKLIPARNKIDLTVRFRDLHGYGLDALNDIFLKNLRLKYRSAWGESRQNNRLALCLAAVGALFIVLMLLISRLWESASVWKDILVYVSDVASTVTIWEATSILVVEQKERRAYLKNLESRFSSIRFEAFDGGQADDSPA